MWGMPVDLADETGGALLNSGEIEIQNTVFAENTATDGGLAVQTLESPMVLWNVTFRDNILSCPSQTYSYTQYVSTGFTSPNMHSWCEIAH